MKAKSKIIVSAIALLSLGVAATTAGTVAWYSSQANATLSYSSANISAPSNLLQIKSWSPYGSTMNLAENGSFSSLTGAAALELTDVVSTKAATGGTNAAITKAGEGEEGKFFAKYALGSDGTVSKPDGDLVYNVTSNPSVKQGTTDSAVTDWEAADNPSVGTQLELMSAKVGRAYARFGFYIENVSEGAISVSVMADKLQVTYGDANDSNAMRCVLAPAGSHGGTIADIPTATAVTTTGDAAGVREADLGLADIASLENHGTQYYVCTIWADGDSFAANENLSSASVSISLEFAAVAL